jgi:hypothetical protein
MLFLFLFSCGPQFFLAKTAMDWAKMDCLGGYQYGIAKSNIMQEIAKRHIDLRRSTTSWRHHNKEIFRCSLYIINVMLFISIEFLINIIFFIYSLFCWGNKQEFKNGCQPDDRYEIGTRTIPNRNCASFYLLLLTTMAWLVRCHFLLDNATVNEIKILIFFSLGIWLLWRAILRTYRSIPMRQLRG